MRILFLTQIIPYPPDAGPKVKTWHVLRYLKENGHDILLASFVRPEEEQYVEPLKEICAEIHTVPIRRSRFADLIYLARSYFTGRPFLIERDDIPAMRNLVRRLVEEGQIDCIHSDQLTMTQFAFKKEGLRSRSQELNDGNNGYLLSGMKGSRLYFVFDAHNAVWTIVERMYDSLPYYIRPLVKGEASKVKYYEGMVVQMFDHILAVSDIDRGDLLEAGEIFLADVKEKSSNTIGYELARITVVPIAVDTKKLKPIKRRPGSTNILTLGTLHYPPNADGIRWFAREVFPVVKTIIPEATLTIVGKNPPQDLQQLAEDNPDAIQVTGYAPELDPYLEQSAMVVVPVRAGSGMRVRILDAFARAMPVVTTSIGLEGIEARVDHHVLVADSTEDFASRVIDLLKDQDLQNQLAINGRKLAEDTYDWKVALGKMEEIYGAKEG